jgi:N-acetylneuraminic acid mutarotase
MTPFPRLRSVLGVVLVSLTLGACSGSSGKTQPSSTTHPTRSTTTTTTTRPPRPEGWSTVPDAPTELGKYAVWTGTEYIGGPAGCCDGLGGTEVVAYAPSSDGWRSLAAFPLGPRSGEATAWTGREMVVVGGRTAASASDTTVTSSHPTATGAALDPKTNNWRTIAPMPATMASPTAAVWTGREVVVFDHTHTYRYHPTTDQWSVGAAPPFARDGVTVVWTGHQMLVWGGQDTAPPGASPSALPVRADGAAYDPTTDTWQAIPAAPVPARTDAEAVWTGRQMILWGGTGSSGYAHGALGKGAAYDPTKRTWRALPASPLTARSGHQMVWTGREVVVWGGFTPLVPAPRDGAGYDPATDQWRRLPAAPPTPPALLTAFTSAWTGEQVLLLGGYTTNAQGVGPLGLAYAPGR